MRRGTIKGRPLYEELSVSEFGSQPQKHNPSSKARYHALLKLEIKPGLLRIW